MNMNKEQMAAVFNEWARRYAENPEDFDEILDENGKPVKDYGLRCSIYFEEIATEMEAAGWPAAA